MKVLLFGEDHQIVDYASKNGCSFIFGSDDDADILDELIKCEAPAVLAVDIDQHPWMFGRIETMRRNNVTVPIAGICNEVAGISVSERRSNFLEAGGNDLIHRPVQGRELLASLRSMHHLHIGALQQNVLECQVAGTRIAMDCRKHEVFVGEKNLQLTGKEFQVLEILLENVGNVVNQEKIRSALYGLLDSPEGNTVQVFIVRLRTKIARAHPEGKQPIETIRAFGYRMNSDVL